MFPVGYSYWPNVNNHRNSGSLLVFVGHTDGRPRFFRVEKTSGTVEPMGALLPYRGTAEGWYWSAQMGADLYLTDGPRLRRVNPLTGTDEIVLEISDRQYLWQCHSSDDGQVHSATVRDVDTYAKMHTVVKRRDGSVLHIAANGVLDESQIDPSGRWLVIKEDDDNRIIDLDTDAEHILHNATGAAGHSDCGHGTLVGEDDHAADPGSLMAWNLAHLDVPPVLHYHLTQWHSGLGHVSVVGDLALISNAHRAVLPRVNELVTVRLDGSLRVTVHCPNLTDLNAGGGEDYAKLPKANLDPIGEYACWSTNLGTDRLDVLLVQL